MIQISAAYGCFYELKITICFYKKSNKKSTKRVDLVFIEIGFVNLYLQDFTCWSLGAAF